MAKPNMTLGIEVSDTSLKLALFDHKLSRVRRLGVVEFSTHPLREISILEKTIQEWSEEAEGLNSSTISLALPARICVVRQVQIPPEIKDIRAYVEWEFSTAINAPRSDYFLDYNVTDAGSKQPKIAVVGAIRKIWLDGLRKGFTRRNLIPGIVEVDAFSLLNLMEQGISGNKNQAVCVVKIDRAGVILVWGQHGTVKAIRWVSVSPLSALGRLEAFQSLAQALTIQLHKGFAQVGISKAEGQIIHLCGDLSIETDFVDALRQSSPDFLYHLLDSFHRIQLDAEGASSNKVPLCATAIGVALRFHEDRK